MKPPRTARVLNVFLASPDDVRTERVAAEELVADLNKIIRGRLGWTIWLHKWEDTTPGFGRPQEIINEAVDSCDLFVGLLWKRWGQPSGKYSSGFEEEYERARSRRKETEAPEIWLIFKTVDEESLRDPGPHLAKVLQFRKMQSALGEILYSEVGDLDDWKRKLNGWLLDYILKLHSAASEPIEPPASSPSVTATVVPASDHTVDSLQSIAVPTQLNEAAEALLQVVKAGEIEPLEGGEKPLDEFQVARVFLLSATWMFGRFTGQTLGTHEINLLYKHRELLEATRPEQVQLFRSLITDGGDVTPGWFWFTSMTLDNLSDWLISIANSDSSADVRTSSVRLLRNAHIELPKDLWPALPMGDESESVRSETYAYLGELGDENTAESLANIASTDGGPLGSVAAREARLSILLRLRPVETFSEIVQSNDYISDGRIRQLERIATGVGQEYLLKALESDWQPVRKLALTELSRRAPLARDIAEKFTKDQSLEIRGIAFQELAKQGYPLDFDAVRKSLTSEESHQNNLLSLSSLLSAKQSPGVDADSIVLAFYRSQSSESVLQAVDWYSIEGTLAYKSLAVDHYDAVRDCLRADLENGFSRIRHQSVAAIESRFGAKTAEEVVERFSRLEDFIRSQFTEAALNGLAVNGEAADIRFGRQFSSSENSSIKLAAVRITSRFGTEEDAPLLLKTSREAWGEIKTTAGLAALRLSPTPFDVARELAQSTDDELSKAACGFLYQQDSKEAVAFFNGLLESDGAADRESAIYFFSKTLKKEALATLLAAQFTKAMYYYNVITWLDRLLYSPKPLRNFYLGKLKREARPDHESDAGNEGEPDS